MLLRTAEPILHLEQRQRRPPDHRGWWGLAAAALILLLLFAVGPLRPMLFGVPQPESVALTLLTGAQEKGAVCLDGTPPGYHLQRGSGDGSNSWHIHLQVRDIHPDNVPCIFSPSIYQKTCMMGMFSKLNQGREIS